MSTTHSVRRQRSRHRHSEPPRQWAGSRRLVLSLVALLAGILALNGFIQAAGSPVRTSADKEVDVTAGNPPPDGTAPAADAPPATLDQVSADQVSAGQAKPGSTAPGRVAGPGAPGPREVAGVPPGRSGAPAGTAPRLPARSDTGSAGSPAGSRSAGTGAAPAAEAGTAARSADRGEAEQPPAGNSRAEPSQSSVDSDAKAGQADTPAESGGGKSGGGLLSTVSCVVDPLLGTGCP